MNRKFLKIVLFLLLLNTFSLLSYFFSHSSTHKTLHAQITLNLSQTSLSQNSTELFSSAKPWPILPSHLPWPTQPRPDRRSCEAFFGNGFRRRVELVAPTRVGSGWFACRFSETLRSSVCEGGRVKISPEKVAMAVGGERLQEVVGRSEEAEMPEFGAGAVEIDGGDEVLERRRVVGDEGLDDVMPEGEVLRHAMREFVGSAFVVPSKEFQCDQWIEEPTLLVTRYEYANLFHTVTDWYSAYVSSRVAGLPYRPHLVFIDGHCRSQMEETWRSLFTSVKYLKNFTGSVCFRHAILSPLGYETALFKGLSEEINCHGTSAQDLSRNPNPRKTARLSEFGEMVRAAFDFPVNRPRLDPRLSGYNVLFVRREDYFAHPRHGGKVESRLTNEEDVFNAVRAFASLHGVCKINVVNGLFAHMSMKEQVRAIQEANVIIGAHGAGLTHIVSALPETAILEIISSQFRRPHFQLISQWKGLEYHAINLEGSFADPTVVVESLRKIMGSIGC